MEQEEENNPDEVEETSNENAVILTEENAPALYGDTAEAHENDIELIDLTEDEEE